MGLQLKYTGIELPAGVGKTFYPADAALADGSLLLWDWSNPACVAGSNIEFATNLADGILKGLVNPAANFVLDEQNGSGLSTSLSAGKGVFRPSGGTTARLVVIPHSSIKTHLYAGGVQANQPNLLTIAWLRYNPATDTQAGDISYWAPLSKASSIGRISTDASGLFVQATHRIANSFFTSDHSYLHQIAFNRTELFFDGAKLADLNAASVTAYDTLINGLNGSISDVFWLMPSTTNPTKLYRVLLEEPAASGRSALEAVKADYDYVMNYASFVGTV